MNASIDFGKWLQQVRLEKPLVHNITNWVVTNIVANAEISMGASPVMAYAKQEVADMARIAKAVALNMGTLNEEVVEAMLLAGQAANQMGVPVVFDPVGVGATPYRTETARALIHDVKLSVLRGNRGELSVLLGTGGAVKGVDSAGGGTGLQHAMQSYARERQCIVVATGEVDYVTDGESMWELSNGHPLMGAITGSGCIATGLIASFVAVVKQGSPLRRYAEACVAALTCYNVAGEMAALGANGPGTFQMVLFDQIYGLDPVILEEKSQVRTVTESE
ncbi:hydroxyethylthiazole kinase [Alicyclobacillus sp. SO9]|uniref:hydroxyethylthiazole kinase n=1 Tax=Alicyclobacillus sp. SO9 TaxID=2665646 RepID=UPI0018E72CD4|nr:hydroxyethylthiazole kinase [Alicyclobacillus sp. SO9]QQE78029.1 hydroxyethylthiazole kinase [Alicyclobacillus sp. SO9]